MSSFLYLSYRAGIPIFVNLKGNEDQQEKSGS